MSNNFMMVAPSLEMVGGFCLGNDIQYHGQSSLFTWLDRRIHLRYGTLWGPRSNRRSTPSTHLVVVDQLVHATRSQRGSDDVGHGQARVDVGKGVCFPLRRFGAFAQEDDLRLLEWAVASPSTSTIDGSSFQSRKKRRASFQSRYRHHPFRYERTRTCSLLGQLSITQVRPSTPTPTRRLSTIASVDPPRFFPRLPAPRTIMEGMPCDAMAARATSDGVDRIVAMEMAPTRSTPSDPIPDRTKPNPFQSPGRSEVKAGSNRKRTRSKTRWSRDAWATGAEGEGAWDSKSMLNTRTHPASIHSSLR